MNASGIALFAFPLLRFDEKRFISQGQTMRVAPPEGFPMMQIRMLMLLVMSSSLATACVKRADGDPVPPPAANAMAAGMDAMSAGESASGEPPSDEWETGEPALPGETARIAGKNGLAIAPGSKVAVDVAHVVDGDTVTVKTRTRPERTFKVRMAGINAPECHKERRRTFRGAGAACVSDDEAYGLSSYHFLKKRLASAKSVEMTCKTLPNSDVCEQDRYGRLLATLWADGEDVNRRMVEEGMAMAFTKYPHAERASYCRAEFEARAARRGVWSLAPTVDGVLSLMSQKTRAWYRQHDELCRTAIRGETGTKGN